MNENVRISLKYLTNKLRLYVETNQIYWHDKWSYYESVVVQVSGDVLWVVVGLPAQAVQLLRLLGAAALGAHVLLHALAHLLRHAHAVAVEPVAAVLAAHVEPDRAERAYL